MKVKHSIKRQFSYIFIGLMAGTMLVCLFINSVFLEKYYVKNKQKVLFQAYESINKAVVDGRITGEEYNIELQRLCGKYNISLIIVDGDSKTVKSIGSAPDILTRQLFDNVFGMGDNLKGPVLKETPDYVIRNVMDPRIRTEYIEMCGTLRNGNLFLIRTALEGIRDSVAIANRFLAYVGSFSIIVSGVLIWMMSKKVTEPILELADISKKMTDLDFNAKYQGKEDNEIGLLGCHVNQLSMALEKTISELKTANNELTKDIETKNQIDEMRKDFLSNVSHELKTPIALIQGYAEGLKEEINEDAESREFYCDVIMDEAAKMNTMVKKLLTLNQIESGNDMIVMERFDITELVRTYVQSATILTQQYNIRIEIEETAPIFVWGDEFKTEEVIMNYFSNAMNHCEGDKVISIKYRMNEENVRISVFNTGTPIPEESILQIWDKFYKVDKARTREYGGSGVGLSIVKAIMESMNQAYGVKNYNNGVEFWFELSRK